MACYAFLLCPWTPSQIQSNSLMLIWCGCEYGLGMCTRAEAAHGCCQSGLDKVKWVGGRLGEWMGKRSL